MPSSGVHVVVEAAAPELAALLEVGTHDGGHGARGAQARLPDDAEQVEVCSAVDRGGGAAQRDYAEAKECVTRPA